ncbi:CRAL/TRIO domain-containing protein [Ramaria rubella]|nr:CRAL/TRIO domain-containing protein [Ramaria rubella]
MSTLKGDKEQILAEFRRQVETEGIIHEGDTIGTDDETLLRFLRARKFDIKNAKAMLAAAQEWRKTVEGIGIDEIYDEIDPFDYPERDVVFKYWPMRFHKTDKEGRPMNFQTFGAMDVAALYRHVGPERHWRALLATAESLVREVLPACSRAKGSKVNAALCVVDLKGFGVGQFWQAKHLVKDSFYLSQNYYPETMGRLMVVNAPASFTIIWGVVKRWLAPETIAKVDILGTDYVDRLLEHIDAENLPANLGGTCTCDGLGGCNISSAGPWLENRVYTGHGPSKYRPKESDGLSNANSVGPEGRDAEGEKVPALHANGETEKLTPVDANVDTGEGIMGLAPSGLEPQANGILPA